MAAHTNDNSNFQPCDFSSFEFLGAGSIGRVYRAKTISGDVVAIKKIFLIEQMADLEKSQQREIDEEGKLLRSLVHDNIVTCLAVINHPNERELWIVMELLENGTLKRFLRPAASASRLNDDQIYHISRQCWSALAYLHGKYITHRDIKPENILVRDLTDGTYLIKFCDFQLSVIKERTSLVKTTRVAGFTHGYAPPETADDVYHPIRGDVYSLGVTLCELHTSQLFWGDISDNQVTTKLVFINVSVKNHGYTFKNPTAKLEETYLPCGFRTLQNCSCSDLVKTLLLRATSFNQTERPTADQALEIMNSISTRSHLLLTEQRTLDLDRTIPACNLFPKPPTIQAISEADRTIPPSNVHFILKDMYVRNFEWHPMLNLLVTTANKTPGVVTIPQAHYIVMPSPHPEMAEYTFFHDFRQQSASDMNFVEPVRMRLKDWFIGWTDVNFSKIMAWNPQGTLLAMVCNDGSMRLWTPQGDLVKIFDVKPVGNKLFVEFMRWNPEGTHIFCKGHKMKLSLWNSTTGEKEKAFANTALCKSCDWQNNEIFACSIGNVVDSYSVNQFSPLIRVTEHKTEIQEVKWDPSGNVLASLSAQELTISGASGSIDTCVNLDYEEALNTCMAWNNDNTVPLLASGSASGSVLLWDVERGTCTSTFSRPSEHVNHLAFSPTNTLLAAAYRNSCSLHIWDTRTGEQVLKYLHNQPQSNTQSSTPMNRMQKVGWNVQGDALSAVTTSGDLVLLDLRHLNKTHVPSEQAPRGLWYPS